METHSTDLILASSSPRRRALLADIGLVPAAIVAPACDETPLPREKPRDLAVRLARLKALAVAASYPDKLILAADTVVGCGRRILPKAETPDDVRRFLSLLSGRRHRVHTAVALVQPGGFLSEECSDSVVMFQHLTAAQIDAYAATGEGIGKAGGYAVQGQAALLIKYIAGSYSGIVGLPLFEVGQLLRRAGWLA